MGLGLGSYWGVLQLCGHIASESVSRFDESSASLLLQLEDLMMRQAGTRSKPSWSLSVRSQAMMQICHITHHNGINV